MKNGTQKRNLAAETMMALGEGADVVRISDKDDTHTIQILAAGPINGETTLRNAARRAGCRIKEILSKRRANPPHVDGNVNMRTPRILNTYITATLEPAE